jgi:hypothetical protein
MEELITGSQENPTKKSLETATNAIDLEKKLENQQGNPKTDIE